MEVKKKRGRPKKNNNKLEKKLIIEKAKELTLKTSYVPSIRNLAANLNVDPMAIYYYFKNKDELLNEVSASLIESLYEPNQELDYRENVKNLCNSYISLLLQYPDLVPIFLSNSNNKSSNIFKERIMSSLNKISLCKEISDIITNLLVDYIHGFTIAQKYNKSDIQITVDMANAQLNFIVDNIKVNNE